MGWQVYVCRVIISMLCIMGGRRVSCIVGICTVCMVDSRENNARDFVVGKAGFM